MNTAIWHFLENTDFCEWWQLSVLKQVVCDWSQTENSCSEKCIFLLKSIVSKDISSNFFGCERHRSSLFQKGQRGTWSNIVLHEVQWFFIITMNPIEKVGFWGTYYIILAEFNEWYYSIYLLWIVFGNIEIMCIILLEVISFSKYFKLCSMRKKYKIRLNFNWAYFNTYFFCSTQMNYMISAFSMRKSIINVWIFPCFLLFAQFYY